MAENKPWVLFFSFVITLFAQHPKAGAGPWGSSRLRCPREAPKSITADSQTCHLLNKSVNSGKEKKKVCLLPCGIKSNDKGVKQSNNKGNKF